MGIREAQAAAKRVLEDVRPHHTRATTVQNIANAVIDSPELMVWFVHVSQLPYHDGKIDSNSVADALGEALWQWKAHYEIGEDSLHGKGFEELAYDPQLVRRINGAVAEYDPDLAEMLYVLDEGIDWREVDRLYQRLGWKLRGHQEELIGEASELLHRLLGELDG